jgi:cytochrome c biogenesis protein CcdA
VLPILLGASIGRRAGARPAFIAAGFVASFAFVALALNAVATVLHFDPDVLRTAGLVLLVIFGALMIWPAAFDTSVTSARMPDVRAFRQKPGQRSINREAHYFPSHNQGYQAVISERLRWPLSILVRSPKGSGDQER